MHKLCFFLLLMLAIGCEERGSVFDEITSKEVQAFSPEFFCHEEELIEDSQYSCFNVSHGICTDTIIPEDIRIDTLAWYNYPMFCTNVSDRIYFKSTDGRFTAFEVIEKEWIYDGDILNPTCQDLPGACFRYELAYQRFQGPFLDFYLLCHPSLIMENNQVKQISLFSFLLKENISSDFKRAYWEEFSMRLLFKDQERSHPYQEHDQLDINEVTFSDVIDVNIFAEKVMTIFYNKDYGLIGFVDKDGVNWNLVI